MDDWKEPDWEHVRNIRLIGVSLRTLAKAEGIDPRKQEVLETQAERADAASDAMERMILKLRSPSP